MAQDICHIHVWLDLNDNKNDDDNENEDDGNDDDDDDADDENCGSCSRLGHWLIDPGARCKPPGDDNHHPNFEGNCEPFVEDCEHLIVILRIFRIS